VGIASMTGFARTEGDGLGISWVWEIKSVNGKSLDRRRRLVLMGSWRFAGLSRASKKNPTQFSTGVGRRF